MFDGSGALLGGDAAMPAPASRESGNPRFYGDSVDGEPARMMVAWMSAREGADAPRVLVQVAETLNKRTRFAWEMLANVVLPQLLLILMATAVVYLGVSRGLAPLKRLRARCPTDPSRPEPDRGRTACPAKSGRWWTKSTS